MSFYVSKPAFVQKLQLQSYNLYTTRKFANFSRKHRKLMKSQEIKKTKSRISSTLINQLNRMTAFLRMSNYTAHKIKKQKRERVHQPLVENSSKPLNKVCGYTRCIMPMRVTSLRGLSSRLTHRVVSRPGLFGSGSGLKLTKISGLIRA